MTAALDGPELWIKRDDQTGLATGGNKTRALEFLIADAIAQGADVVVTAGAAQSNHARQTAAAAAHSGLACTLALRGPEPGDAHGNLLLDRLVGARVHWVPGEDWAAELQAVADDLCKKGHHPYIIPYGGSNAVGAIGYVAGMEELLDQASQQAIDFDRIVFASASGGFQAGVAVGARALESQTQILGIAVEVSRNDLEQRVARLATETATRLRLTQPVFTPNDLNINDQYLGGGYGVASALEREAIYTLGRTEGILVDPVYTGRALGGLLDLIRRGEIGSDECILFWHTGGFPGLFMPQYAGFLAEPDDMPTSVALDQAHSSDGRYDEYLYGECSIGHTHSRS